MNASSASRAAGDEVVNVLFIDNFDSFVFNLVDEFASRGSAVSVS